ncbi:DUF1593 domain-containing protein [Cecembia rubra]|uniref:Uncharacterized protein DUF1593 n=1 Tax=Cecembia rubra TaxID=1485585 RepID=A0A2P8DWW4_9BACT|nr:DUF1593 domain-containing protein [Cecembia rubra]PSL01719.1 uncharacterized protein DUF1593 [Cecembia rubra]
MKNIILPILFLFSQVIFAQTNLTFEEPVKQRVLVLTDITNEPDDQQSLVRFLVYANEYDIEGIIATTSTHLRNQTKKDKIEELVRNYGQVKSILDIHANEYPSMEYLLSITSIHLPLFSMEGVGEGKDSPGSELLIKAVDKSDDRPLWVSVWGGANCLAQALWKVKNTRPDAEVSKFVEKIRVYAISDQDFSGQWIRQNFPGIFYIVDASAGDNWREYYKATWTGIGGDVFYKNGPGWHHELVENQWLIENIAKNHGPLGALYPPLDYIMEGDTPSFFGLIQNGLAWYKSPAWGGWAGRYEWFKSLGEVDKIWTSSVYTQDEVVLPDGSIYASNQATIWRWRKAFQHDFAARMDWNIAERYKDANHNPILVLNGNEGKAFGKGKVKAGDYVRLSSKGTYDPDGDQLRYKWWVYREAGNFNGKLEFHNPFGEELVFQMPQLGSGQELHIILEVEDSGTPSLFSYRRIILTHP